MAKSKISYLPDTWNNDAEMKGLMSMPKAKHVNPTNYNRIIDFWKDLICKYCKHENTCLFTLDELKNKFRRGSYIPSPLNLVIQEMQKNNLIQTQSEYEKKNQSWLKWGISFFQPTAWFGSTENILKQIKNVDKFVHIEALKYMADALLRYYHQEYELADCPEVVEYSDLKSKVKHLIEPECFELVIGELVEKGEVSIGKSRTGDKVLKFKDQSTKGPAQFTDVDASVHELRKTMFRLEGEINKAEEKMLKFQNQAFEAYKKNDKKVALQFMKKKKRVEEEIGAKDKQYQNLLVMMQQLAQSKQTREILDIYKESSAAFKAVLNRQGLTVENVDTTMENVHEALNDIHEIEEALRFSNMPSKNESIQDEELESELNQLIAETGKAEAEKESIFDKDITKIRAKKREYNLSNLPDVPTDTFSSSSTNKNGDSLEMRWKRLCAN